MTEQPLQPEERGGGRSSLLADMVAAPQEASFSASFSVASVVKALVLALMLVGMNLDQFPRIFLGWREPNWSHGPLIPLFSLYLVYVRRHEILSARRRVCVWALPALVLACLVHVAAYRVQNPWSCQVSMAVLAVTLIAFLGGMELAKLLCLPIMFLVFAMPIPPIVYVRVAYPLQELAAGGAGNLMKILGFQVETVASSMQVISASGKIYPLVVEEVCSGMRLLVAFMALGVAMAYLEERPIWQRVILVFMGVPVAVACNVVRVTITCFMYYLDKPQMGKGFMHEFTGMLMLIPAFAMLWFVGWLMRGTEESQSSEEDDSSGQKQGAAS